MHRNEAKEGAWVQNHVHNGLTKNDMIQQGFVAMYVHCYASSSRSNLQASIAGSNSTAHTIRMTLLSTIAAPWTFKALQKEIDEASSSVHDPISWHEIRQLPYLQAVIKEGLRMHPSIQFQLPRYVPTGGVTIRGTYIPEGTEVSMSPVASNRDSAVFGEDAHIWDPDRWLVDRERAARMDKHLATVCYDAPSCQNH